MANGARYVKAEAEQGGTGNPQVVTRKVQNERAKRYFCAFTSVLLSATAETVRSNGLGDSTLSRQAVLHVFKPMPTPPFISIY